MGSARVEPPWDDLKVAYGINDPETVWKANDSGRLSVPAGWELVETDCTGARCVAVFRVAHLPTLAEGRTVQSILRRLDDTEKS